MSTAASLPALAGDRLQSGAIGDSCSIDSAYGLEIGAGGLRLEADDDAEVTLPGLVEISDGTLRVDGKPRAVSKADAARLQAIESGVRGMLPEIAAVSCEATGIAFDALGEVNAALTGNRRQARDFERLRERALARVDEMAGRGEWPSNDFGDEFEAEIAAAAETCAAAWSKCNSCRMLWSCGWTTAGRCGSSRSARDGMVVDA